MYKRRIFTPGPTPLMPAAQLAASKPIVHHRTEEFRDLALATRKNLQKIFKTTGDVVILSCSGTGAMEATVANLVSTKNPAMTVSIGKFGERWVEICQAHGHSCVTLSKEPGQAAEAAEICRALENNPDVKTLFLQGCETSTGTMHDLEAIGNAVREGFPEVLLVVDGITAVGSQPLHTDEWGLDVVISGSQKSFAMSPGLAFVSLNQRALKRLPGKGGSYYFNLGREVASQRQGKTTFTPAVSLYQSLFASTSEILDQGIDRIIEETAQMARATRAGLRALRCTLLSTSPANAATAAFPPPGVQATDLMRVLEERFGVKLAGGQGKLKSRIFRIAHLGYFDFLDVVSVVGGVELAIGELSGRKPDGSGLRATLASWP